MPLIDFSCVDAFGIIVKAATGVKYSTQTCGTCCRHPQAEGFYVPLNAGNQGQIEDELHKHLCEEAYKDINLEAINEILQFPWVTLEVDKSKIDESEEAWLHVTIKDGGDEFSPFRQLKGMQAVFIYGNCD